MTAPLPDRIAAAITSYWRAAVSCDQMDKTRAELDAAIAEVVAERDALRSERDAALLVLPACCGSLADAADTLRQDRDAERARADGLAAELAKYKADGAMLCRQIDRQQLRISSLREEQKLVDALTTAVQAVRSQAREKWKDLLARHDREKAQGRGGGA